VATARRAPRRAIFRVAPLTALAALAAVVGAVAPATTSAAAPQLTLGQVQARVAALNAQAERITEAYDGARVHLATVRTRERVAGDRLKRAQSQLAAVQKMIGATANAAYRSGGFDQFILGGASNPQAFLDQTVLLDALTRTQAQQLETAAAVGHAVDVAKITYGEQVTQAQSILRGIAAQRAHINALLAQARSLLNSLRAADRARLAAEQAAERARQLAMRARYSGPASGRAAVAVRFAYAQLGKPYVYGAAGPSSYDCSGLTMAAWNAAGVSLPHNAAMQQSMLPYVPIGSLQPGDLTFFGSPAYHVAIYIGGGRIIEAPHTGDVVKIVPLSSMPDYSGAGRP
jgi:cell wall-associated NlpC family hydrolase